MTSEFLEKTEKGGYRTLVLVGVRVLMLDFLPLYVNIVSLGLWLTPFFIGGKLERGQISLFYLAGPL